MKNKNLLKQNLLILVALIFCWLLLLLNYFNFYSIFNGYIILWLFSLVYLLFFLPFSYIQNTRIKSSKNIEKLNKVFRTVNWIFIFGFIATIIYETGYELFFYCEPGLSAYYCLYAQLLIFDSSSFKDLFIWLLYTLPYLIVITLFYQSIKLNKRLQTS